MPESKIVRRPLKSRGRKWAQWSAMLLLKTGITPNRISVLSIIFSLFAGACFLLLASETDIKTRMLDYFLAALFIQLRLLCNLMDGMVAIEGGLKSKTGDIFNEFPDRIADVVILVGAGYSLANVPYGIELGWIAAIMALLTAYIRAFAGSIGTQQHFIGPMAKPHRMATLTLACLFSLVDHYFWTSGTLIYIALILIIIGAVITSVRRTARILKEIS